MVKRKEAGTKEFILKEKPNDEQRPRSGNILAVASSTGATSAR
ncbi:hypothetical protein [Ornithinibacillus massiliensis]|nr:hypothetical protein [Ornithinibacillus massiliensis]